MEASIKIEHISKDFPVGDNKVRVLFDINAEISRGKLTMLVGPSGCGKTTLISIITGILSSTEGDVIIEGKSLKKMSDREKVLFRRENIGFIFQQYNLLPSLTAAENAAMPLLAAGVSDVEATRRATEILDQIGMEGQAHKLPRQLSGGQQQRVAIARALVHNPKLIVCDEPTAALDAKTGRAVMEILREIANNNERTVLIVTHDNRIFSFADRILDMSDGKITGEFTADEYIHKETI